MVPTNADQYRNLDQLFRQVVMLCMRCDIVLRDASPTSGSLLPTCRWKRHSACLWRALTLAVNPPYPVDANVAKGRCRHDGGEFCLCLQKGIELSLGQVQELGDA